MPIGLLVGAAAKAFAPQIIREGVESGVGTAVGKFAGRRVSSFLAGTAGQQMVGRAAGTRLASALASETGQKATRFVVKKEVSNTLQGEGRHAPQPKTKIVTQNKDYDASNANLTTAPSTAPQTTQQQQFTRQRTGGTKQGSGWMGTGKGWWEQNEQLTQRGAFDHSSVTTLGDFSAARGPANWAHAGGNIARKAVAYGAGVKQGYQGYEPPEKHTPDPREPQPYGSKRTVTARRAGQTTPGTVGTNPTEGTGAMGAGTGGPTGRRARFSTGAGETTEADVVEHNLTNVTQSGRGSEVTLADTAGTYQGMGTQVGGSSPGRLDSFSSGTGELGTGPLPIGAGPASAKPRRKAGMGQYGRDRFHSMMADVGY